jgi:uncharacterized iron-regulated protein
MPVSRLHALCVLVPLLLGATTVTPPPLGNSQNPYPLDPPPQIGDIVHLPTGIRVSHEQMLEIAGDSRLVYVGETHDNPAAHRLQLDVLQAIAARYPGQVSLGMEMFTPAQQPVLDRWSAGELDEKHFLRDVHWYSTWQSDFDYYRDLLTFARDQQIPVIGINAEKKMVQAVSRRWDELSEQERAALPELDLTDPYHTAMVAAIYGDHVQGEGKLAGFARVQALWDETMATSIATYLQSPQGRGRHMVVLAGGNHVRYGFGIPRRVFRRLPLSYTLIGSRELEIPESKQDRLMNVDLPDFPLLPYDFLTFTRYEDLPGERVKLGVQFEQRAEPATGLSIIAVVEESSAASAGLQAGDVLLSLDSETLADSFDLVYAIGQKRAGDRISLTIERDGVPQEIDVILQPLPVKHGQ